MSSKLLNFKFLQRVSLATGLAVLLADGSAIAQTRYSIAQATSSDRSVVVDTEEDAGTSTQRTPTGSSPITTATRFSCQRLNGEYTVVYQPESQPGEFFPWAKPAQMGGGWSPQRRCNEIARRLESYRPDGLLELTTGVENSYNTVCVTTERVPACRIVFTVPNDQDPAITRDRVFENLTVADSGQQTDAINTYRNRNNNGLGELVNIGRDVFGGRNSKTKKSIDLRPFLDAKDGGTGNELEGGVKLNSGNSNSRLNPGKFR